MREREVAYYTAFSLNSINETYRRVRIGKKLSDALPIQKDLKQGDALSLLIFYFPLQYAIRKVEG
jgi:hypothetical protein